MTAATPQPPRDGEVCTCGHRQHAHDLMDDQCVYCTSDRCDVYRPAAPSEPTAGGVDPAEIVRQRAIGWPDFHPEDFCHQCGRPNPTWFADTAEWQAATGSTGDGGGILCPSCFAALYRRVTGRGAIIWRLSVDPRSRDAEPPATDSPTEGTETWRCGRCGSPRWVSVSLDQGFSRRAQCVPCGWIGALPATPSPVGTTEPQAEMGRCVHHAQRCEALTGLCILDCPPEPPAETQQDDEPTRPIAHRDAAGVLWVPVELDPAWTRLAARPSADTETLLPVRAEIIRQVREAAWREGYEACRRGQQPHNPYRAALDAR